MDTQIQVKKIGRPLKFKSGKQITEAIENYFINVEKKRELPTITGLALELDMTRETLLQYEGKPEFSVPIKKAKEAIRAVVEQRLLSGKPPIGLIFWLKNNAGWRDEQYQKHEGSITHGFVALPPLKPKPIEGAVIENKPDIPHR